MNDNSDAYISGVGNTIHSQCALCTALIEGIISLSMKREVHVDTQTPPNSHDGIWVISYSVSLFPVLMNID